MVLSVRYHVRWSLCRQHRERFYDYVLHYVRLFYVAGNTERRLIRISLLNELMLQNLLDWSLRPLPELVCVRSPWQSLSVRRQRTRGSFRSDCIPVDQVASSRWGHSCSTDAPGWGVSVQELTRRTLGQRRLHYIYRPRTKWHFEANRAIEKQMKQWTRREMETGKDRQRFPGAGPPIILRSGSSGSDDTDDV